MLKLKCERVYLGYMHLGDIITSLNILYNYALHFDTRIEFCGQNLNVYKNLFDIFDYKNYLIPLQFNPWKAGFRTLFFNDHLPKSYLNICFGVGTIRKKIFTRFALPDNKFKVDKKDDFLCFQFVCRSPEERKSFTFDHMKLAFKKFETKKSICIGGHETKQYILDREIYKGNLKQLAGKLLESSGFFGIDSGMSHLCGSLKIHGDVIIQAKYEEFYENVKNSYNFLYPTIKMYSKSSLWQNCNNI